MERWRYIFVSARPTGAAPRSKRDGWGSARALRREWFVRPTPSGEMTQAIAPPLFGELEARWEGRFGVDTIDELRQALAAVLQGLDVELPEYLPIVGSANGMAAEIEHRPSGAPASHLSALLAQALLTYTLDFERRSELSLPLIANFVRVLGTAPLDAREIPRIAGVSKEATSMALNFLKKTGHVSVDAKRAPDRQRPGGAGCRSRAPCGRRTGMEHAASAKGPGTARPSPRAARRRPAAVSGRLAGQEALCRTDERRHRGPDRKAAALSDGAPPWRLA